MDNSISLQVGFWGKVTALCIIILSIGCGVKVAFSEVSISIDFATLLSVLLALFSVALSVLFYFKATETSNAFYDNTYKYTRDIAELLVRIEASFGEKLTHLDAGYRSLVESQKQSSNSTDLKTKIEEEKAELEKVLEDRTRIIDQLIESSQMASDEKTRITEELKSKDQELKDLGGQLQRLIVEMRSTRNKNDESEKIIDSGFRNYTRRKVVAKLGVNLILDAGTRELMREFDKITESLHEDYLRDMGRLGFYKGGLLTMEGIRYLKEIAESDADS